jgi:hypothetical protein
MLRCRRIEHEIQQIARRGSIGHDAQQSGSF